MCFCFQGLTIELNPQKMIWRDLCNLVVRVNLQKVATVLTHGTTKATTRTKTNSLPTNVPRNQPVVGLAQILDCYFLYVCLVASSSRRYQHVHESSGRLALVLVSHCEDVSAVEKFEQLELGDVGVLALVDSDVFSLISSTDIFIYLQKFDSLFHARIEVEPALLTHLALVITVGQRIEVLHADLRGFVQRLIWANVLSLVFRDEVVQRMIGCDWLVNLQEFLDEHVLLASNRDDGRAHFEWQGSTLTLQQVDAECVEGAEHTLGVEQSDTFEHFLRRCVGERQVEDVSVWDAARTHL